MHIPLHHDARLGIDIGRVIIGAVGDDGRADTSFLGGTEERALATPPEPGAFETIRALTERLEGRVWLVSKCGARIQALSRRWLAHHGFHTITGVPPEHLRFCKERPQKRDIALELGLTHFIDDRLDVLRHLSGLVPSLYWFGRQDGRAPDWVIPVRTWRAVRKQLLIGSPAPRATGRAPGAVPYARSADEHSSEGLLPELRDHEVIGGDVGDEPDDGLGHV